MDTAAMATRPTTHVVLFPFPGHGHLPGMLAIARLIRRSFPAVTITLVSTPRNVAAIRADDSASSLNLSFHALPFAPADHGLPDGCESLGSLPVARFITLFEAFETLAPAFDDLIATLSGAGAGVCVVADPVVAWTVDVARRHGCAHAVVLGCSALGSAIMHALWRAMPALPFDPDTGGEVLRLRVPPEGERGEEVVLHRTQLSTIYLDAARAERWTGFQRRRIAYGFRTDAVVVNTVEELEPRGLAMVRRTLGAGVGGNGVSVHPVGPLVKSAGAGDAAHPAVRWLDTQRRASVLYICFGSQNSIRARQMAELAAALDLTRRPFLWAMRAPVGADASSSSSWLPEGFEERARGEDRGLVVRGWAPQVSVLAHAATGAFLSHCGWNSTLESLAHGVPVVGWPVSAEQFYNATMLQEELGVGVEAARGNLETSEVDRDKLAQDIEAVMGDSDAAEGIRRRAAEVKEMLGRAWAEDGGSSAKALQGFFAAMRLVI